MKHAAIVLAFVVAACGGPTVAPPSNGPSTLPPGGSSDESPPSSTLPPGGSSDESPPSSTLPSGGSSGGSSTTTTLPSGGSSGGSSTTTTLPPGGSSTLPPGGFPGHENLNAVLWTQSSVEFAALALQTYRGAVDRLDEGLADPTWTAAPEQAGDYAALPPAVVMDLDETVIDNSAYQAWVIAAGGTYDAESWSAWCEAREAGAIPGALEFVRAAVDRGVTVFFVSNRAAESEQATRDNLEALGFGFALADDVDTVLLAYEQEGWRSDKGSRRAVVAAEYRIVLSVGDNLGDFVDGYKVSPEERRGILEANADAWGVRWIVLPNPQYGSWESALFGHDWSMAPADIAMRKLEALRAWSGP